MPNVSVSGVPSPRPLSVGCCIGLNKVTTWSAPNENKGEWLLSGGDWFINPISKNSFLGYVVIQHQAILSLARVTADPEKGGKLGLETSNGSQEGHKWKDSAPWNSPVVAVVGETLNLCSCSSSGFIFYWALFVERIPMVKNQFKPLLMRSLEPKKGAQAYIAISGRTRNEVSFSQQKYYNFLSPSKNVMGTIL